MVVTAIVSNILENSSILTGFPFGHYYYTDSLGPKIALVPFFISLSYISFGYLAWVFSTLLVSEVRKGSALLVSVAVPLVASFVMVAWDFCLDPIASTINHAWIWKDGGGYFGVPFSNYLGWSFTVYIFFQLFACTSGSMDQKTWVEHYQQPTTSRRSYSTSGQESGLSSATCSCPPALT